MARIPESVINNVREQTNIVDFIGQTISLTKKGQNYFGLCPFHEEKTPSFSVSEEKQIFHCFSCGRGGNVFKFDMEYNNVNFIKAVQDIALFSNIKLDPAYAHSETIFPNNPYFKINQQAEDFFNYILNETVQGEGALKYLEQRNVTSTSIEKFKLGFLPDKNLLLKFMGEKKHDLKDLRESGLFVDDSNGKLHDRFKNRLIFPIVDQQDKVLGFSGRALDSDNVAKYLNTPETKHFIKGDIIYNINNAKDSIRKSDKVYLAEGYMDVIAMDQVGISNVIASMGTSLTDGQIKRIKSLSKNIVLIYDGDEPGKEASARAIAKLEGAGFKISLVRLPDGLDPADYINKHSAEEFVNYVNKSEISDFDFLMEYYSKNLDLNNDNDKIKYLEVILSKLTLIKSPIEQDVYLHSIANNVNISYEAVLNSFRQLLKTKLIDNASNQTVRQQITRNEMPVKSKLSMAEQGLLFYLISEDSVYDKMISLPNFSFIHDKYQSLYELWKSFVIEKKSNKIDEFMSYIPQSLNGTLAEIMFETMPPLSSLNIIDDFIKIIENQSNLDQLSELQRKIKLANLSGNQEIEAELVKEYINLIKKKN